MFTRRHLLAGGLAGSAVALVGCGSNSDSFSSPAEAQTLTNQSSSGSRLYVLGSASGASQGRELRLRGVDPNVVWFEDRPGRTAGRESTAEFVQQWTSRGFTSDPPNAVLDIGAKVRVPVILQNPSYDAGNQTLTFAIQADQGASLSQLPQEFGACSLFIDNAPSGSAVQILQLDISTNGGGQNVFVQIVGGDGSPAFSREGITDKILASSTGATISSMQLSPEGFSVVVPPGNYGDLEVQLAVRGTTGVPTYVTLYTQSEGVSYLFGGGGGNLVANGYTRIPWSLLGPAV